MRFLKRIGCLVLLAALAGGFAAFRLMSPYQGFAGETFVEFPRGTSTEGIADRLAAAGVVRSRWDFLLARAVDRGRVLQAGEYRFDRAASPLEVFDRIARGDVFYYTLVVPEGQNIFDIAQSAGELGLFSATAFLEAARNPAMIRDLDPDALTLEGYLFPNTYKLSRHATPESACRMMTGKFREVWRTLQANAAANTSPHDVVTLASMIEREAKLKSERPLIAAVFTNRLRIGMKLDCDPTTIYAALLENRYRGGDLPLRLGQRQSLQHVPPRRAAAGSDCKSGRRFAARRDGACAIGCALFCGEARRVWRTRILAHSRCA